MIKDKKKAQKAEESEKPSFIVVPRLWATRESFKVGFSISPKIRLPFLPVNFEKFTGKNGKIGKKTVNFVFRFLK